MTPLTLCELRQLVSIMSDMLLAAQHGEWHELYRLDGERRAVLAFENNSASNASKQIQIIDEADYWNNDSAQIDNSEVTKVKETEQLIEEVKRLDKLIISTIQSEKSRLLSKNRELTSQVKAKELYAQTSRIL